MTLKEKLKAAYTLIFIILMFQLTQAHENGVSAEKGVIDLSVLNDNDFKSASLNGEWIFFPDTLIAPDKIASALQSIPYLYIQVPSKRKETKGHNFGTYYLHLKTTGNCTKCAINTLTIYSAARIYVNKQLVGYMGNPGQSMKTTRPALVLNTNFFEVKKENQVVIQYANFYREKSGIANNISLISSRQLIRQASIQVIKFAIIIGTLLFIIFNQINYFFIQRKNYTAFFFGLASIMIAIYISFMSVYHLGVLIPDFQPNFKIGLRLWRISYHLTVCFFALYIYNLFKSIYHKQILYLILFYTSVSVLIVLFMPLRYSSINLNVLMYFTLFVGMHGVLMGATGVVRKIEDSRLFLLGFGFFLVTVINDVLHNLLIIKSINMLDVGIFGMMLTQAQLINSKLNRALNRSEDLSRHLQFVNTNLEGLVHKRTEEIEEQKTEIEAQRDFAMSQHKLILQQKKTITDSINYACEIQKAVLPDEEILKQYFADSFILFKPKDYVSGDFYWIRHVEINQTPHLIFCVADCTGHGVPGALLSMLGMSLLGEIIGHNQLDSAAKILELLRKKFKQTLSSRGKHENSSDGMHMTLCMVNKQTGEMQYSGAFQSLFHLRNSEFRRYKGTNCIIGSYMKDIPFENHKIQLQKGDRLYLFTDGFADQMSDDGKGRFTQKRLLKYLQSISDKSYDVQRDLLIQEFEHWKGSFEQIDDLLVMGVKL